MAVMTEWKNAVMEPWRDVWRGDEIKAKPTDEAPFNRHYIVKPRIYTGSRRDISAMLVRNCCDESHAKGSYCDHFGIDPNAQYADVQRYEPTEAAETAGSNNPTKRANVRVVE